MGLVVCCAVLAAHACAAPAHLRQSVNESLSHAFFENAQLVAKRIRADRPVDVATIDFENREMKIGQLRDLILGEIQTYGGTAPAASSAAPSSTAASVAAATDAKPAASPAIVGEKRPSNEASAAADVKRPRDAAAAGPTPTPLADGPADLDTPGVAKYLADTPGDE